MSSPTLASSSPSSTCSFLLYPQGLSSGCQPEERHDGQDIKPDILPTWSHLSLWSIPSRPQQPEAGSHLSLSPRDLRAADSVPRPLLPVFAPSPGVPISWGLPPLWPTSGGLALSGPYLWPLGAHTGSWALTSPAAGGARVTAAGASAGSARRTDPHSAAGRPGSRAGSDVRVACGRCPSGSARAWTLQRWLGSCHHLVARAVRLSRVYGWGN